MNFGDFTLEPHSKNDVKPKIQMIGRCIIHIKVFDAKNIQEKNNSDYNLYLRFGLKGKKESTVKTKIVSGTQNPAWDQEFDIFSKNCSIDILKVDMFDQKLGFEIKIMDKIEIPLRDHNYGEHYTFNNSIEHNNQSSGNIHFEIDFLPFYDYKNEDKLEQNDYKKEDFEQNDYKKADFEQLPNQAFNHLTYDEEARRIFYKEKIQHLVLKEKERKLAYEEKVKRLATEENLKRLTYEQRLKHIATEENGKRQSYKEKIKQHEIEEEVRLINEKKEASQLSKELDECISEEEVIPVEGEARLLEEISQNCDEQLVTVEEVEVPYNFEEQPYFVEGEKPQNCDEQLVTVEEVEVPYNFEEQPDFVEEEKPQNLNELILDDELELPHNFEEQPDFIEEEKPQNFDELMPVEEAEVPHNFEEQPVLAVELSNEELLFVKEENPNYAEEEVRGSFNAKDEPLEFLIDEFAEAEHVSEKRLSIEQKIKHHSEESKLKRQAYEEKVKQLAHEEEVRIFTYEEEVKHLIYEEKMRRLTYKEKIKRLAYEEEVERLSYESKIKRLAYEEEANRILYEEKSKQKESEQNRILYESILSKIQKNSALANEEIYEYEEIQQETIEKPEFQMKEDLSEMNEEEKLEYFNNLVNYESENRFEISIQQFYNLTYKINKVTEKQFDFMIDYYKYMQSKGQNECKIIFLNLEVLTFPMINKLFKLKDFSFQFLSDKAIRFLINDIFLYENMFNELGHLCFLNEKIAYNEINNQNQRDNYLKKTKKSYYSLFNQINDEIRIFEGSKIIESHLFDGYTIEKVFIPSSVLVIEDNAFYKCRNLTTVSLESVNMTKIGKSAFSGCENLRSFVIPSKVTVIEEYTFKNCRKLEKVTFPKNLQEIKEKAFYGCKSLTFIELPETIQKVGSGVFKKCRSLQTLIIPGILYIYPDSNDCEEFETSSISSVKNFCISSKCFYKCKKLKNVFICQKCQKIGDSAFSLCASLKSINFSLSSSSKIGKFAFKDCPSIKKVEFSLAKDCSLEIGDSSFQNCVKLKEVCFNHPELFSSDALKIDSAVFSGCINLSKFNFPPNCNEEIGENCFNGCEKLESVTLPANLTKINTAMFKDCVNLSEINLGGENITVIGSNSFENCSKLKFESLPSNLQKIGNSAFRNCSLLNFKKFPNKIEEIGQNSFENCSQFSELIFPESTKVIHKKAFQDCSKLEKVTIYSSSLTIKKKAFYNCVRLKEVLTNNKEDFSSEAFENCAQGIDFFKIEC